MAPVQPDYSLYLVTDSTPEILGDRDVVSVVEKAIDGGVTIVQYRDKTSDTADLIRTAQKLHAITKAKGVPLLINDRVDVALAIGCEGVHIGQDDMDFVTARSLLGPQAIIGVTASNIEEARTASAAGANYLGIGTIWSTPTKKDAKSIIGISGLKSILSELSEAHKETPPVVCIGGVSAINARRVLLDSATSEKKLSGIAVVSAIMGASNPKESAENLIEIVRRARVLQKSPKIEKQYQDVQVCEDCIASVVRTKPICHNMTNLVVQNFAANVTLAIGGSPIMANDAAEAADLASFGGSLVINMGSATPESIANYKKALMAYNQANGPIVLDPVGAGATALRRSSLREILAAGHFTVIKGNESEIQTVLNRGEDNVKQRGVDSNTSNSNDHEKAALVREVSLTYQSIVLMTGSTDFLSDGNIVYLIKNGHSYLGKVTGTGCTLGSVIAACLAANKERPLAAVLSACVAFEIAAEKAAERNDVRGAGTFVPAFLDELGSIAEESLGDNRKIKDAVPWTSNIRVTVWDQYDQ